MIVQLLRVKFYVLEVDGATASRPRRWKLMRVFGDVGCFILSFLQVFFAEVGMLDRLVVRGLLQGVINRFNLRLIEFGVVELLISWGLPIIYSDVVFRTNQRDCLILTMREVFWVVADGVGCSCFLLDTGVLEGTLFFFCGEDLRLLSWLHVNWMNTEGSRDLVCWDLKLVVHWFLHCFEFVLA